MEIMPKGRKITVEVPFELLENAQRVSGDGIAQTVRKALAMVVAYDAQEQLRRLRGQVRFTLTAAELKVDR